MSVSSHLGLNSCLLHGTPEACAWGDLWWGLTHSRERCCRPSGPAPGARCVRCPCSPGLGPQRALCRVLFESG